MGFSFSRETKYIGAMWRMLRAVKTVDANSNLLIADELEMRVDAYGQNIAFIEGEKRWTYDDMETYANRVAAWAKGEKLSQGDCVAVFARNRIEYVALWFGLSKLGVIPALLNYQLSGKALAHCVNISDVAHVILDVEMAEQWEATKDQVEGNPKVWAAFGEVKGYESFDSAIHDLRPDRPNKSEREGLTAGGQAMKMFTSGTTGLPKAAKITHVRAQNYLRGIGAGAKAKASDRMMMVLPMYHATGGLVGCGAALTNGGAVIIIPKFSASRFWDDAVQYGATMFTYVGELCRFLLSQPHSENERKHKISWIIGNGLRPEVWESFVSRFDIPHVIEFYGATEGNVSLINVDGPIGAVGRVPSYLSWKFNIDIVRFDVDTNENPRGADGFCIREDPNVPGEMIGEIRQDDPRFRFEGYGTKEATQKKILRDVFKKGDAWFRTGDLMSRDEDGFFYFIDRVGDTYRWKAENVSTNEVAGVLSVFPGVTQANVYGVEVKGYDGRAGMAAIVADEAPDLAELKAHVERELPHYARPVFLRLSKESDTTSTFKFKKTNLVKAGFNPANISEPLYYADAKTDSFLPIAPEIYAAILEGSVRL